MKETPEINCIVRCTAAQNYKSQINQHMATSRYFTLLCQQNTFPRPPPTNFMVFLGTIFVMIDSFTDNFHKVLKFIVLFVPMYIISDKVITKICF